MQSKVEKLPGSKVKITVGLNQEEFKKYLDQAITHLSKDVEIKGFRRGQAPQDLVLKSLSMEKIVDHALEHLVPETYSQAVKENKLVPISQPKIKVTKFVDRELLEYEAEVEIIPEITLGDWKKIRLKPEKAEVQDSQIDEVLKRLQKQFAKSSPTPASGKKGDRLTIDINSARLTLSPGKEIERLLAKNFSFILGEGIFIPGFEEKIIGAKKGEEREFEIIFPADFKDKELAGKEVKFKILVKEIENIELPLIDDEFSKKISGKNLEDFKKQIYKDLLSQAIAKEERKFETKILKKILEGAEIDALPETLVEAEIEGIIENIKENISSQGGSFDDWLNHTKKTLEELKKEILPQAEENVKLGFLLGEITKEENIKVTEQEIDEIIKKEEEFLKEELRNVKEGGEMINRFREYYSSPEIRAELERKILGQKTLDHIKAVMTQ